VAGAVSATLVALLPALPAHAAADAAAPRVQQDRIVPGHLVGPRPGAAAAATPRGFTAPAAQWPADTVATVTLGPSTGPVGAAAVAGSGATSSVVGPVRVAPVTSSSAAASVSVSTSGPSSRAAAAHPPAGAARVGSPSAVQVHVFDHAAATSAGIRGLLLSLQRVDGVAAAGPVAVTVDYAAFGGAYGGDWSSRLRLVELSDCVTVSPVPTGCRSTALPFRNDRSSSSLAATVSVGGAAAATPAPSGSTTTDPQTNPAPAGGGVFLAAMSGPSGSAGSYAATTLSPTGSWSVGGTTGDFQWTYPFAVPPAGGGAVPRLSLTYDSAAVDGEMASTNNQPSWVGQGFELSSGYIERSYGSCSDDMGGNANNTTATGDLCWVSDNATLSLGGHSGELIKDANNPNRWHLRNDDGTFVEHLTGAANGAQNGEYWRVTTSDGTQFLFGSTPSANSTLTEPVYGNNPGEPCYQSSFAASSCSQGWRWSLDQLTDPSGNTVTYHYAVQTNEYAADDNPSAPVTYDRSDYLTEIDYGTRVGGTTPAPERVLFTTGPRCVTSSCSNHDATDWPDTAWDQQCTGSPCYNGSPTFWSTVMLTSVSTQLYSGTGSTYTTVMSWALAHAFLDPGDGTTAGLWLSSITQTGSDGGGSATLPAVTFTPVQLQNRVDPIGLGLPPMNWMRVAQITTETGNQIQVSYSPIDCVPGSRMPSTSDLPDNPYRCYPVIWTPPGATSPITDFFNKYVVTGVNSVDLTTPGNPTTTTAYAYQGNPDWHYTDDAGITPASHKTWSVWRGYGDVRVTTGVGADATTTETFYFRGMNGDHLPSGTRSVQLPALDLNNDGNTSDSVDLPAVNDDDPLNGMTRETLTWNGSALVSATGNNPWESAPTASRTLGGLTVNAVLTGIADSRTEVIRDGGRAPRTTSTHADFDATYGVPVDVQDNGDDAVSGDEACTITSYDRATSTDGSTWLVNLPSRVQKFATTCAIARPGGLTAAQATSDTLSYYDGATSITTPPSRGKVTRVDEMKDWSGGAPVYLTTTQSQYDATGRVTSSTDVRGNATTTAYTLDAGGQLTGQTQTNVLGWITTNTLDPATGLTTKSVDPNGRITAESYDGLGRLTGVWQPGRDQATQTANVTYGYLVRNNAPTVVTTTTLTPSGGTVSSYTLYDGMLRSRQTQTARGDGQSGALITDTLYDTAGRAQTTNSGYLAAVTPGTSLFVANQQSDVPDYTITSYDGAGRVVASTVYVNATGTPAAFATTTTTYGGDRVDVDPPIGGTATSTTSDAHGNTIAVFQYHNLTPTPFTAGSYDTTSYTYNAKNQLTAVTDPAGNVWTTTYDNRGRIIATSDPDNGTVTTGYDDAGDVTSTIDGRGITLDYTYDQTGRKTAVYQGSISPANELAAWTYDGVSGAKGQLSRTTSYDGGNAFTSTVLGFSATYQPTAVQYSIPAAETGLAGSYTYVTSYNVDGSLNTLRLPTLDGGALPTETLTQGYTSLGQPASLSTSLPTATTLVPSIQYTGYGEPGVVTLQTNTGSDAYLADYYEAGTRRLTEYQVSRQTSPTTVSDTHFSYDQSGNPTAITDSVSGDNQCFSYDYLDRLVSAWSPANSNCTAAKSVAALGGPAPYWTDWTYNPTGTRTSQVQHDTTAGVQTTTYTVPAPQAAQPHTATATAITDNNGTRTAAYGYDQVGNTIRRPDSAGATQTLTWNPQGHVATITDNGQTTSYTYDVEGNRLIERDSGGKTLYLPGQELRYTAATGTKATTRYYTEAGRTIATRSHAGLTWLATDPQGSVNTTIDAVTQSTSIRRTDPFGNPRGATSGTPPATLDRGFVGGVTDATGLTHLGAREYDPALGRFVSVDPVLEKGVPQRFDGYAYCADNPLRASDPAGTDPPTTPPPGAPTGGGWQYYYYGSGRYYYDSDGFRIFFTLDWYAYCQASGTDLTCLGDPNTDTLYLFSNGIGYDVAIYQLAPPPPPPCTNTAYIGAASPGSVPISADNQQAGQSCASGDWVCQLGELAMGALGIAAIGACAALTDGICGYAAAALLAAGPAYNLLSGRDAGNNYAILGDALNVGGALMDLGGDGLGGEGGGGQALVGGGPEFPYGPFHRIGDSPEVIQQIIDSGELWGRPSRFDRWTPVVQAYSGPFPVDDVFKGGGFEFYTRLPAYSGTGLSRPGQGVAWAAGNEGVRFDEEWAKIDVLVTQVFPPKP
jgi:RHS repeat-associated protein